MTRLSDPEVNSGKLGHVFGVIIGALDRIVISLVNLPPGSLIRTPVGQGLNGYFSYCNRLFGDLLGLDKDKGLEPRCVIELCAIRFAGLTPESWNIPRSTNNTIGYWNAQQGLLLTPIFERALYSDLPPEKLKPLTLYNIPIMGIPADQGGWVKAGTVESAIMRRKMKLTNKPTLQCDIIMENRPNYERDASSVVAVVYIDGAFSHILPLDYVTSSQWCTLSECQCNQAVPVESELRAVTDRSIQPFESFEPGEITVLDSGEPLIIGPQVNEVSRFFSSIIYMHMFPVIQNGCLNCALKTCAEDKALSVIISGLEGTRRDKMPSLKRKVEWEGSR